MDGANAAPRLSTAPDSKTATAQTAVLAVLEGGPPIAAASQARWVSPGEEKIKIMNGGGYEHFERVTRGDDHDPREAVVFRWTMRTKMAE